MVRWGWCRGGVEWGGTEKPQECQYLQSQWWWYLSLTLIILVLQRLFRSFGSRCAVRSTREATRKKTENVLCAFISHRATRANNFQIKSFFLTSRVWCFIGRISYACVCASVRQDHFLNCTKKEKNPFWLKSEIIQVFPYFQFRASSLARTWNSHVVPRRSAKHRTWHHQDELCRTGDWNNVNTNYDDDHITANLCLSVNYWWVLLLSVHYRLFYVCFPCATFPCYEC